MVVNLGFRSVFSQDHFVVFEIAIGRKSDSLVSWFSPFSNLSNSMPVYEGVDYLNGMWGLMTEKNET